MSGRIYDWALEANPTTREAKNRDDGLCALWRNGKGDAVLYRLNDDYYADEDEVDGDYPDAKYIAEVQLSDSAKEALQETTDEDVNPAPEEPIGLTTVRSPASSACKRWMREFGSPKKLGYTTDEGDSEADDEGETDSEGEGEGEDSYEATLNQMRERLEETAEESDGYQQLQRIAADTEGAKAKGDTDEIIDRIIDAKREQLKASA